MSQETANSKAPKMNKFKIEENYFRKLSTKNNNVEPSSSSTSVLKFFGKSFPFNRELATSTPSKNETEAQMKPSSSDYCIGKTISLSDGVHESSERNDDIKRKPLMETTFTSEMDISKPILMTSGYNQTPNDQLRKPFSKAVASNLENNILNKKMTGHGDGGSDAEYTQTSSRISKVSFKRKYKPLRHEDSVILLKQKRNISKDSEEKDTDNDFDKILSIMNSTDKNGPLGDSDDSAMQDFGNATRYSYYALFFMVLSNLIGFGLSLTFQVLLFLKANADRFLCKSWSHWKKAGLLQRENNLLTLSLLIPVVIVVCLAYAIIWTCFGINKFLLTEVPDRVAQMICFNFRIVSK